MRCPKGPLPESAEELKARAAAAQASTRRLPVLRSEGSLQSRHGCFECLLSGCAGCGRSTEAAAAGDARVAVQRVAVQREQEAMPAVVV